jgi:hypothetical protein
MSWHCGAQPDVGGVIHLKQVRGKKARTVYLTKAPWLHARDLG